MKHYSQLGILTALLATSSVVLTGNLDSPAAPDNAGSAMYTLENIYDRLNDGTTATKRTGAFTEPSSGPGSTGHTLDDVYDLANTKMGAPKTGQTKCYNAGGTEIDCTGTGQDGEYQKGTFASSRFSASNGTVTDNLTGLIWLQNANCFGQKFWTTALSDANGLATGSCSLTDGSSAGDWRLPNVKELQSLVDFSNTSPSLPGGHPFSGVQASSYWSSTSYTDATSNAWFVHFIGGFVVASSKTATDYVWPVRGGQ
jgi:hypothetical protein